ncbi:Uncharacterised protein [Hungatella hathewayi]|uniref:Uncharacterized protein n=1 Tax=Hungatella hathewayi TaxID=154046 RepID=A0A173YEE8_9FIRM|nr:Uncharacterised protein [Hungatella hathewayi]
MTFSIFVLPTFTPTNRVVPTGGVMVPIHKLKIIMMPKCTVFIPSFWQIGRKIGVKIRQAGVISMNVPIISRRILMINRITYRLLLMLNMASETAVGIPVKAITQLMMLETPIKKMMIPVISALSKNIFGSSEILMDL